MCNSHQFLAAIFSSNIFAMSSSYLFCVLAASVLCRIRINTGEEVSRTTFISVGKVILMNLSINDVTSRPRTVKFPKIPKYKRMWLSTFLTCTNIVLKDCDIFAGRTL